MSIDKNDIEKYIFDPQNPQQCKSYKLLLNIAKKKNLVYVSSEYVTAIYENIIINNNFKESLWDIPKNFDELNIFEKIDCFKKSLSQRDYINYIDTIELNNSDNFIYKNIFNKFIDLQSSQYQPFYSISNIEKYYDKELIHFKLKEMNNYSYNSYNSYINFDKNNYASNKILFTNELEILNYSGDFYDMASIAVTCLDNAKYFFPLENESKIDRNIKPLFLKDIKDLKLLLNILQNDLNKEKSKGLEKEVISTIDSIEIKDFFSIEDLKLENLKDKKEIYILGENGDGKTLLLQAIAVALKGSQQDGQLAFREIKDTATLTLIDSNEKTYNGDEKLSYKNMLAYGANRNNNSLVKEDETGYLTLFDGSLDLKNPVDWLKYLDHSESKGEGNIVSVAQAKKLLNDLLNRDVEINITATTVTFTERDSEVLDFDRLSAGYKGVITIICDMLVRLSDNQPFVTEIKDFQGVVLIDEVELHLHPKWEYNFMTKIREIFPNIQFIVTTHSPTVILGASKEAVFYKIYKDEGNVCISNQIKNEGYTNNSLISSPIFDLKTITSRDYDKKVSSDDFIYEKIHEQVSKRIEEKGINIDVDEITKLIDEELDKI